MYTDGVVKILKCQNVGMGLNNFLDLVAEAGYKAASFNDTIYCRGEKSWIETPFVFGDFNLEILPKQIEMYRSEG